MTKQKAKQEIIDKLLYKKEIEKEQKKQDKDVIEARGCGRTCITAKKLLEKAFKN